MYTGERSGLAKLRAYHRELNERYAAALQRRDWEGARRLSALRRRVKRAILLCEEWQSDDAAALLAATDSPAAPRPAS